MKDWICKTSSFFKIKNKYQEIQIGVYTKYSEKTTIFNFQVIFDRNCDHAGFRFVLNLFGFNICYNHLDCRHWDNDTDDWCKYPE